MIILAGDIAVRKYRRLRGRSAGADKDYRDAVDLGGLINNSEELGPFINWLMIKAENILLFGFNRATWNAAKKLAQCLIKKQTISSREAADIIRKAMDDDFRKRLKHEKRID